MSGQPLNVVRIRSAEDAPACTGWDDLPDFLRVIDLQRLLDIGESAAYSLLSDLADAGVALRRGKKIFLNRDRFRAWWESGDLKPVSS